jgi:hypothetical protein
MRRLGSSLVCSVILRLFAAHSEEKDASGGREYRRLPDLRKHQRQNHHGTDDHRRSRQSNKKIANDSSLNSALEGELEETFAVSAALALATQACRRVSNHLQVAGEPKGAGLPHVRGYSIGTLASLVHEELMTALRGKEEGNEAKDHDGRSLLLERERAGGLLARLHRGCRRTGHLRQRLLSGHMVLADAMCDLHASEVLPSGRVVTLTHVPLALQQHHHHHPPPSEASRGQAATITTGETLFKSGSREFFHFVLHKQRVPLADAMKMLARYSGRSIEDFAVNVVLEDVACTTQLCSIDVGAAEASRDTISGCDEVMRRLLRVNLRPENRLCVEPVGVRPYPCSLARGLNRSSVRYAGLVRGMPDRSYIIKSAFARGLAVAPNFFGIRRTGAHMPFSFLVMNAARRRSQFRELLVMKLCNDLYAETAGFQAKSSEDSFFDLPWRKAFLEALRLDERSMSSKLPSGDAKTTPYRTPMSRASGASFERIYRTQVPRWEQLLVDAAPSVFAWNLQLSDMLGAKLPLQLLPARDRDVLSQDVIKLMEMASDGAEEGPPAVVSAPSGLSTCLAVKAEDCASLDHLLLCQSSPSASEKRREEGRDGGSGAEDPQLTAKNAVAALWGTQMSLCGEGAVAGQRHVFSCPVDGRVTLRVLAETSAEPLQIASDWQLASSSSSANGVDGRRALWPLDRQGYSLADRLPAGSAALHVPENTMKCAAFEVILRADAYIGASLREVVALHTVTNAKQEQHRQGHVHVATAEREIKESGGKRSGQQAGAMVDDQQQLAHREAFQDPANLLRTPPGRR